MKLLRKALLCQDGATSIEYALIAVLISITIITWGMSIGSTVSNTFNTVGGTIATSTR